MTTVDPGVIRRIRLLIPDTDMVFGEDGDEYIFDDQAIEDFYSEGQQNTKIAAGLAKITIGGSEALIGKVITNYETKTDASLLAKQWLAMGNALIAQGQAELSAPDLDYFDIVYSNEATRVPEGTIQGWPGYPWA